MSVKLNTKYVTPFLKENAYADIRSEVEAAHDELHNGTGKGNDFLGWLSLPENYDKEEFARIKASAEKIRKDSEVLVVIGIGGSYLGARAAIEFIKSQNYNLLRHGAPEIYFAGNTISSASINELVEIIGDRDFSVNVISKSGTTTEPAVAFRIFREMLESKYGAEEAAKRIYATTDKARGTLKALADAEGYETFVVPDDVGGRYSVLTAVGLLPIAVAGIDIDAIMQGAAAAMNELCDKDIEKNDCYKYAATRNLLYRGGKKIEMMVSYEPAYTMMNEWFKQLYGESEGKDNKGIFPASVIFSTDLHSLGQYIQDGVRNLFETVIDVQNAVDNVEVPNDEANVDGLNFLSGTQIHDINRTAMLGTLFAHNDGGVPNTVIEIPDRSEKTFGNLVFFFEFACAVSGYMLGVNPFDQPGVEAYKKNMFALLGKPGYEEGRKALEERMK